MTQYTATEKAQIIADAIELAEQMVDAGFFTAEQMREMLQDEDEIEFLVMVSKFRHIMRKQAA